MNKYEQHGINYQEAMNHYFQDEHLFVSFLKKFPNDPSYNELIHALNKHDFVHAFEAAHKLKGVTGNLSLKTLYSNVCILVEELRCQNNTDYDRLMKPITSSYLKIIDFIHTL